VLTISVPECELFDERTGLFSKGKETVLNLEHSLVSLSKWESKWCKPFLSKTEKTREETLDYIACMTITQNVDLEVYTRLTSENLDEIHDYIDKPMTATVVTHLGPKKTSREIITAELIYYWMIALQIPFECQKWHLNRLFKLIEICSIKNAPPPKKMSSRELMRRNTSLNAQRRQAMGSRG
jgi:hypothetical protein